MEKSSNIFRFKQFSIVNERSAMKVNTDGVLLGALMTIMPEDHRFLDIGTGTGTIALMAAQRTRGESVHIDAIDIDGPSASEAAANFRNSPWGDVLQIIKACKEIANKVKNNIISIDDINENVFENHLYSKDLPMIDLLIRTSNEKRLSNFMLYQLAYAELYFTKVLWPDFNKKCIDKAFKEYSLRKRRFGGV